MSVSMVFPLFVLYLWLFSRSFESARGEAEIDEINSLKVEAGKPPQSVNVKYKDHDVILNSSLPHPNKIKIMGGQETDHQIREAPSVVSIMVFDGKKFSHKCGGTICSDDRVITSAFCVHEIPLWHILIHSGTDCLDSDDIKTTIHRVKEVKIHEHYNYNTSSFDIAILQTIGKFDFHCFTPPIQFPLPIGLSYMPEGTECEVYGWGYIKEPDEYEEISSVNFPNCLRKISVKILKHETCRKAFVGVFESFNKYESPVTDHQVCAAGNLRLGGQDVCLGDEGTPLICHSNKRRVIVGIASYGFGCGRPRFPGVYTSVFQLLPWISKNGCPLCNDNVVHLEKSYFNSPKISPHDTPVRNEL